MLLLFRLESRVDLGGAPPLLTHRPMTQSSVTSVTRILINRVLIAKNVKPVYDCCKNILALNFTWCNIFASTLLKKQINKC